MSSSGEASFAAVTSTKREVLQYEAASRGFMRRTPRSFHCSMPPRAGGKITSETFEELYSDLVARLWKNMNLDGLILNMHGAAVLEMDHTWILLLRIREELCKIQSLLL